MKERGLVFIAVGHPYYGCYAANLASSLKSLCDVDITLFAAGDALNHLGENQRQFFNEIITLEDKYWKDAGGKIHATKPKVYLYDLSPYNETIYMDVDVIGLTKKPITDLFNQLSHLNFTTISEGYHESDTGKDTSNKSYPWWGELGDILKSYSVNKIYKTRSEFIYFKKCDEVKQYFEDAKRVYERPLVSTLAFNGGGVADEFAFNIAGAINFIYPHADNWTPIYWEWEHRKHKLKRNQIIDSYYGYSLGGNRNLPEQEKFYNDLSTYFAKRTGLKYPMLAKSKKEFMKNERRTL
jgi:hypothetical protein